MPPISHTVKTKGYKNTAKRFVMIYSRYTSNGFMKSLDLLIELLEKNHAKATLPINAITLERNVDTINGIRTKSIEWAMHGYQHTDYTKVPDFKQHLKLGQKIFSKAGIKAVGFRAPYLGINKKMLKTLAEAGFHWDSSRCYLQKGLIPESGSVDLILDFYKPMKKWELASHNGLMEIPLSLPDDEILVDRLGYKGKRIGELWIDMCEKMVDAEQVPVLQLHPERARLCRDALDSIFEWARKSDIEFKFLSEIAKGRFEPGKTIVLSGDIDYMTISDFKHLRG